MITRTPVWLAVVAASCLSALAPTSSHAIDVDVTITVDNAYGFGFGDASGMTTYFGGIRNQLAGEIFNGLPTPYVAGTANVGNGFTNVGVGPESYALTGLSLTDYLYLVGWSDDGVFQGAIASFQVGGSSILTGSNAGWEVYATGRDRDSNIPADTLTIADLPLINGEIAIANANGGAPTATSVGWVDENGLLPNGSSGEGVLVFGETNTPGSTFAGVNTFSAVINGVASDSQWMWYNEDPASIVNPFRATSGGGPDGHKEFLIFRIPLSAITVPEPGSIGIALVACLTASSRRVRRRSVDA